MRNEREYYFREILFVCTKNCQVVFIFKERKEYELARQILKSGTSIGANVEEAIGGFSRKDFSAKLGIAYKEARETNYWLRLLHDVKIIDSNVFNSMNSDCVELLKIIGSILKTLRE